jgi:HK97 family phage portal protein
MRGNSYAIIERRGSGDVISLYPVPAGAMQRKRDASNNMIYGVTDGGKTEWYPAEKIWHTKGFSFNGLEGLSPIAYAREAMALALAGEEFNARLFGQGLMPSAKVSIPNWLTDEQRKVANAKLLEMHTGLQNMNKPMLLEGGMKVEDGILTPDDAQFLQLRQFTVVEICRLFNIKPHMVASLEQATNNNIEQLSLEFVTYTMLPYLRRDEVGARKLFKPADRSKYFYRYNFEGLLRADSTARALLYSIMLQNGVFNRNEVRGLENKNQSDDPSMDQFTVQSNMAMIDQIAALVAGRNAPPAKQPAKF